jgi:hypothetical protein
VAPAGGTGTSKGAAFVDMKLEVFHDVGGVFQHTGTEGWVPGRAPDHQGCGSFASFSDPDGNGWLLQEITTRLPGR